MSFIQLVLHELRAIVQDKAIAVTLFGGVLFYSVLYPLPYSYEVPTEQKLVVVDQDNSSLSRKVTRHADASPKLQVVAKLASLPEAQRWIESGKAHGVLHIPQGFRRDLMLNRGVTLGYGGDANFFLVYSAVIEGLVSVGRNAQQYVQFIGLLAKGNDPKVAKVTLNPIELNSVPVFNPNLGYMGYVVPGVLLLVLHQTLLIGTGILGAGQWRHSGYWSSVHPLQLVLGRLAAFGLIYSIFASYYLGWCAYFYGLRTLATLSQLALFMLPFLLATCAAGIAFSCAFVRRDLPTQFMLVISMPILFLTGFIWPLELIPEPLVMGSQLMPGVPGIMAIIKLNQMGAPWESVADVWLQLWGLFVLYFAIALIGVHWRRGQLEAH